MAQRAIRFAETTDKEIQAAARKRGFSSPTAFIRHLVEQELSGRSEELLDSLAKVVLTCVPEPSGEAMEAAVARARGRHARLLKSAGQAMVGDSQLAMQDLVKHGEG